MTSDDDDDDDDITPSKPNRLSEQTGMAAEACKKNRSGTTAMDQDLCYYYYCYYCTVCICQI